MLFIQKIHSYYPFLVDNCIIFPCVCFISWAICYVLFGQLALFGGSLFALGILLLLAIILGHAVEYILHLPPMLGMITAGLLLKNVPQLGLTDDFDLSILSPLRGMSVAVLLTRGALSVDVASIKKFKWIVPQLAVGSCVFEALIGGIVCYFILEFSIPWAAAMGCIMSAMSQAGALPYYLNLEKNGRGLQHNVIQVVKSGCGLDAILAINLTEFCFGAIFSNGDIGLAFQKGPLEVLIGAGYGIIWGGITGNVLNDTHGAILRTFVVFVCGSISLVGFPAIGFPRGGPIGCWLGALVYQLLCRNFKTDEGMMKEVSAYFTNLWYIFQPLLFAIIGVRIDFSTVDWTLIERSVFCLLISLIFRMVAAFTLLCYASEMTFCDKLFVAIAWTPKGTVQAALGPVPLDTALSLPDSSQFTQDMAYKVMCVSTLVIVMASSIGGSLLTSLAPYLLKKQEEASFGGIHLSPA